MILNFLVACSCIIAIVMVFTTTYALATELDWLMMCIVISGSVILMSLALLALSFKQNGVLYEQQPSYFPHRLGSFYSGSTSPAPETVGRSQTVTGPSRGQQRPPVAARKVA